jgi:hypothetical protein
MDYRYIGPDLEAHLLCLARQLYTTQADDAALLRNLMDATERFHERLERWLRALEQERV